MRRSQTTARSGCESAPTFYGGMLATTVNHAPEVSVVSGGDNPIHLAGNDMYDIVFRIDDAEGQQLAYSITDRALLNVERSGNNINVRVFASRLQVGEKSFTLTVTDIYGATATAVINGGEDHRQSAGGEDSDRAGGLGAGRNVQHRPASVCGR